MGTVTSKVAAAAARTATSDHAPEQIPGFIHFATPSQVCCRDTELGRVAAVSISQSVSAVVLAPGSVHAGRLTSPPAGITCVVFTASLLTLIPFPGGNLLMLCEESLNHTVKQTQGLTVLATLI